jgi:phosphoribosylaminoimidazolecarboxamide formyltransferase/IMP cyclohydrolase
VQTSDVGLSDALRSVTKVPFPKEREALARFGIAVTRSLRSNAVALVREQPGAPGSFQLVGAGQGQPNRVEALERLALPRARAVLHETGGKIEDCLLISDAFFPFRDTVDRAHAGGIRAIVQPGGSLKDAESITACDEQGIAMALTGVRHFKH